jgi:hypothetical protein
MIRSIRWPSPSQTVARSPPRVTGGEVEGTWISIGISNTHMGTRGPPLEGRIDI